MSLIFLQPEMTDAILFLGPFADKQAPEDVVNQVDDSIKARHEFEDSDKISSGKTPGSRAGPLNTSLDDMVKTTAELNLIPESLTTHSPLLNSLISPTIAFAILRSLRMGCSPSHDSDPEEAVAYENLATALKAVAVRSPRAVEMAINDAVERLSQNQVAIEWVIQEILDIDVIDGECDERTDDSWEDEEDEED
jgi:hypothetical protein